MSKERREATEVRPAICDLGGGLMETVHHIRQVRDLPRIGVAEPLLKLLLLLRFDSCFNEENAD